MKKMMKSALVALVCLAVATEAASIHQYRSPIELEARQNKGGKNNNNNKGGGSNLCLQANAIQKGSQSTGQQGAAADGQVASKTDPANFMNICSGKTLTDGEQKKTGSCNGIPMGEIPATTNMVSTVITNPKNGDTIPAKQTFNVQVNVANMQLGSFTNATSTYYSAPQALSGGKIVGHCHVTIQDTGNSLNPTTPLDATKFAFFKGINDAGNGKGQLQAVVTGGLPAGNYRACTMTAASNHQPVLMPVAQRGAQDDCKYFTVSGNGGGGNNNAGNAGNANNNNKNNKNKGTNNNSGNSAASASSASSSQAAQGNTGTSTSDKAKTTTPSQKAKATETGGNTFAGGSSFNSSSSSSGSGSSSTSSGSIGGIERPAVSDSGDSSRPFSVNGNTFVNKGAAIQRACAIQHNSCADAVNAGKISGFSVGDCGTQEVACNAAGGA